MLERDSMKIKTYIFSYNRGENLENLLQSARDTEWRGEIIIYDDCSTDLKTIDAISRLEKSGYKVFRSKKKSAHRLGGLYENMTAILKDTEDEFVMFLQDDMQFVRKVDLAEIERMCELMCKQRSPFLFPSFFTRTWSITNRVKYDRDLDVYTIEPPTPFGGASDVCIFNRRRLTLDGWEKFETEQESDRKACNMYGSMTIYPDPFVAFTPFPPIPRMNILKRIVASRGVSGVVRYATMTTQETLAFKSRNKAYAPIGEDVLTVNAGWPFRLASKIFGVHY